MPATIDSWPASVLQGREVAKPKDILQQWFGTKFELLLHRLIRCGRSSTDPSDEQPKRLPPLYAADIQRMLLLAVTAQRDVCETRWCRFKNARRISSVVLIVLKDVSFQDFEEHPDCFPCLMDLFKCVEIINPQQYGSTLVDDMVTFPLRLQEMRRYLEDKLMLEHVLRLVSVPEQSDGRPGAGDVFPRTSLLLSTSQMIEEGYPMPVDTANNKYEGFVYTKEEYTTPTVSSPLFALDCEMCETIGGERELARISIVTEDNFVIYDELVKPRNEITNYHTNYSGMTEELLLTVTTRLEDVQKHIRAVLPSDAILCGQSLNSDLTCLKMFHPFVIDTSVIFASGSWRKFSLKALTRLYLNREIQVPGGQGHCSSEDAIASMDLVKLKLQEGMDFGDGALRYTLDGVRTCLEDAAGAAAPAVAKGDHRDALPATHAQAAASQPGRASSPQSPPDCSLTLEQTGSQRGGSQAGEADFAAVKSEERAKKELFFRQEGSVRNHSFFGYLERQFHTSARVVGRRELISSLPTEECRSFTGIVVEDDEEACRKALDVAQRNGLTWVELASFADRSPPNPPHTAPSTANTVKGKLSELDGRVSEMVSALGRNAVVTVVMAGRQNRGTILSAAAFVHVN